MKFGDDRSFLFGAILFLVAAPACSGESMDAPGDATEDAITAGTTLFKCVASKEENEAQRDVVMRISLTKGSESTIKAISVEEGFLFAEGGLHQHSEPFVKFKSKAKGSL